MNTDYKTLYEQSEKICKTQKLLIAKQEKNLSELTDKHKALCDAYEQLEAEYEHALSICDKQQALLDQIFKEHPDL